MGPWREISDKVPDILEMFEMRPAQSVQLWAGLGSSLLGQAAAAHPVDREGSGSRGMRIVTFLIPAVEPPSRDWW